MSDTSKKFYITTSIPYVNARPHIGFAMELIQADVLARYHRFIGDDTFFLTGTSEHGSKVPRAAAAEGKETLEFVNEKSHLFRELCKSLDISNSHFIRTIEQGHHHTVEKFWKRVEKNGDIYKAKYEGLYCIGCENYYTESELVDGRCPIHKTKPEFLSEENYFFKFSKYQKQIEEYLKQNPAFIVPKTRYNEVLQFVKGGLRDISISRSSKTLSWGVRVPGDSEQIVYIWFDELLNYISGIGFSEEDETFKKYWPADIHLVGKDIARFHATLWPGMLLSAGLSLPKQIFVHGFISVDGEKISKSLGNVVDPFPLISKYGVDALRYFLLRAVPSDGDGDFSIAKLEARYTGDLVNNLGNLVSRLTNLIEKHCDGIIPELVESPKRAEHLAEHIANFRFHEALAEIWTNISWTNQYIDQVKLWELPEGNKELFRETISSLSALLKQVGREITPFLPSTAEKIDQIFRADRIKKSEPLFPRLIKEE